jgi:glucose-1-phosphate thymidylyltransferase
VQDEAGGIAQALGLAENFARGELMAVILGDNVFEAELKKYAEKFRKQKAGARILLKEVDNPQRFGVAQVKGNKIIGIEEKPAKPKSNYAVTGIYFYDRAVFEIIRKLKPSGRGELEITDVNNAYIEKGLMEYDVLEGWWSDAGTFESLRYVNGLVTDKPPK